MFGRLHGSDLLVGLPRHRLVRTSPSEANSREILKQGVCLALLGAGLAAVPATWLTGVGDPRRPVASAAARPIRVWCRHPRHRAAARSPCRPRSATGQVGFVRAAGGGDLLPGVAGSGKAAAARQGRRRTSRQYGGAFGAGQGELTRQRGRRRPGRRLDGDLHPDLQGRPGLRRAAAGPRRRRRRPDLGQRLRRPRHRPVDRPRGCRQGRGSGRAIAFVTVDADQRRERRARRRRHRARRRRTTT